MKRFQLMNKIAGTDKLAELFNAYLKGLDTMMMMAEPSYVTMAEVRAHTITKPKTKEAKNYQHCAKRYYELLVLRFSLENIHEYVLRAIASLEGFYATYDDNLLAYALDNRLKTINEYGSDDEADWEEDGLDEDGKQKWKITHRDTPEALKYYTLHEELSTLFGGESSGRGEAIGTSTYEDFYPSTGMVAQQSELSFRKMVQGAWGADLVRVQEDGTTSPIPLADHIEAEMNTDIKAAEVVDKFNGVLQLAWLARDFYLKMSPDDLSAYAQLYQALQYMRDVAININA